jgi:hypothetical protein
MRLGKAKVMSQHTTSISAEPIKAYNSPPHW